MSERQSSQTGADSSNLFAQSLLSRTRTLLRRFDLRPVKRLGQHFLIDGNLAAKIADATLRFGPGQVVEIGAGLGALTLPLAESGIGVTAYESDRKLRKPLEILFGDVQNVDVRIEDFLKAELDGLAGPDTVAAGNLPFYITTPILEKLLEAPRPLGGIVVTVQKEVAERILAEPGSRATSSLTMYCQYHLASIGTVCRLPPNVFLPQPEVESVALTMTPRESSPEGIRSSEDFFDVVRGAFGYRRKTLRNALAASRELALDRSSAAEVLDAAAINPDRRAESLSFEEFVKLANAVADREDAS